ncbi:tRNA (adenosine(37)-N6)-threonylcarbamoyltransferase complex ATPase subunit type 1 TsaE [Cryobacterium algoricola]|uniref:tRNA threonylcarbamoyladenosine biosynthesis protein TsaE n=1 Tax=Cryobacterium algoricola TaxID=1259183 RepID=A0ABY2IBS8_9MICO|nr:tRNA (adenosine(37)-N6)-threonylcarbamoyltransferase complex ATPase subunit type 1 TsaE [Cryobacterium algoricola]TFB87036.1 tRNA (adenosine(37)-N6)-threonylcarbamoyltransferase complex ATPase subunit type 1 TsaE [Cryobacterium algoricola]
MSGRVVRRVIPDAAAMHEFGVAVAAELRAGDLVVLTGPLGAGKTTFTRGLGAGLGVRGAVTSPTFVLARAHPNLTGGPPLVHVDAYRLQSALELDDLDIDFEHSVVVVEWGRGLLDGVAESWLDIEIERPTGALQPRPAGVGEPGPASAAPGVGAPGLDLDVDLDEPRTVTITGFGPRWPGFEGGLRGE